ncbi:hypothetical protein D3C80_1837490 [compost metagenome]
MPQVVMVIGRQFAVAAPAHFPAVADLLGKHRELGYQPPQFQVQRPGADRLQAHQLIEQGNVAGEGLHHQHAHHFLRAGGGGADATLALERGKVIAA